MCSIKSFLYLFQSHSTERLKKKLTSNCKVLHYMYLNYILAYSSTEIFVIPEKTHCWWTPERVLFYHSKWYIILYQMFLNQSNSSNFESIPILYLPLLIKTVTPPIRLLFSEAYNLCWQKWKEKWISLTLPFSTIIYCLTGDLIYWPNSSKLDKSSYFGH